MLKFKISVILFFTSSLFVCAQEKFPETTHVISSPNGNYSYAFYQKSQNGLNQMYYTLDFKGKTVIEESELGVLIENNTFESALGVPNDTCKIWGENLVYQSLSRDTVDITWKPVYGEFDSIRDHYNEMTLMFRKGEIPKEVPKDGYDKNKSYFMGVIVRAYNEGVAFRYFFPEPSNGLFLHITGEQTQFTMPENTKAYYEAWAQGPYELLPLKGWKGQSERPLVLKLENGLSVALAEAQMVDYARMKFSLNPEKPNALQASLYSSVDIIPDYSTPWRVIIAGEEDKDLIESKQIILNLNPDNKIEDVSWIKPGKVIRVSKLDQKSTLEYIDFASEMGLDYIHLDAGWYGSEIKKNSSALNVGKNRDLNIPEIIDYAAKKNIGLWVYVNQRALYQELDSILPLYKKWGIKGIKFGFVQIGNQNWSTWLHHAISKCAEYGLMVDIHDEYRPTGFSRTYPNLMTQEGIRGNEEFPDATHNTILPFTRFLAGPADYTICYFDPRLKNTHAHQLALSVVYYSPIQYMYWYDSPSRYHGEKEVEFFRDVNTVWDDSRVLNGEIGEYITVARKSGDEWFVGAITNNESRTVEIPTGFLEKGRKYIVKIYEDDDKVESLTKVGIRQVEIIGGKTFSFELKARGGVALKISKSKK